MKHADRQPACEHLLLDCDMTEVRPLRWHGGQVELFSARSPIKQTPNEDAAAVLEFRNPCRGFGRAGRVRRFRRAAAGGGVAAGAGNAGGAGDAGGGAGTDAGGDIGDGGVLVIADGGADITAVCWDLLSQAEHGPDSQAIVISDDPELLDGVARAIPALAAALPRAAILAESLQYLRRILVGSIAEAVDISNRYAPEHLLLNCSDAGQAADRVTTAGSVFIGPWTPEALGDYCSGTNHVLPTSGSARFSSGLSVRDFLKRTTLLRCDAAGLRAGGPATVTLAKAEGLDAHALSVAIRLNLPEDR